ncbi:hypothetical protein QMK33_19320 [Hymenobacter sp. H14-R3]|uniref:hypothetical protein n=1 Tax=Hymenobacter sp. H14-R3 TaxID=3046308 RepID=UPI0024B96249|nr:hypothetical protein [Hymenobacter sp. H14-R3]MDJ0367304.1 hypothetical protein [Hymenobacter sp. H14-R3]
MATSQNTDVVCIEVKVKADGKKILNTGIGGTQADSEAFVQAIEYIIGSPQKALALLKAEYGE